jgi:hypothetical protein
MKASLMNVYLKLYQESPALVESLAIPITSYFTGMNVKFDNSVQSPVSEDDIMYYAARDALAGRRTLNLNPIEKILIQP